MPGPKSTSSASSRGSAVVAAQTASALDFRPPAAQTPLPPPRQSGASGAQPRATVSDDDDDDDGIPLSILHMISNKDNVRNDVNHAELFARIQEVDQQNQTHPYNTIQRPPSRNSSASSAILELGGGNRHREGRRNKRNRNHHNHKPSEETEKRSDAGRERRDDKNEDKRSEKRQDATDHVAEDVPLSPRSALRRKGVLLQELYMHIGQISSQVTSIGTYAPIRNLDMSATLEDVEIEVERAKAVVDQIRTLKFMRKGLVTVASAAEFGNKKFSPWPLELDGFADFLTSGIGEYDGCFIKLYNKYKGKSQEMSPEVELLFLFGSSAFMFHLSKSFAKSAMTNSNFTAAVANAMAAQSQQQQKPRGAAASDARFETASVAGTTLSQQFDESRLVDRLKKSKILPGDVSKLSK